MSAVWVGAFAAALGLLALFFARVNRWHPDGLPSVDAAAVEAMALCRETAADTNARWARLGLDDELAGLLQREGS